MDLSEILQIMSNQTRLDILFWLSDPKAHFNADGSLPAKALESGVCVKLIQQKSQLSQATISQYMSSLKAAGLVKATRVGKWTHYQRNEEALSGLMNEIYEYLCIKRD